MNLLVTNTRNAQAYAIIRALRPYADKIVVTMYGRNRLSARLSYAANSRLVQSYWQTYFGAEKKVFNPYFRYFFQDPLVSILWWFALFTLVVKTAARQVGR